MEQMVKELGRLATGSWLKTAFVGSELRRLRTKSSCEDKPQEVATWLLPKTLVLSFRLVLSSFEEAFAVESRLTTHIKTTVVDICLYLRSIFSKTLIVFLRFFYRKCCAKVHAASMNAETR